jgi:tryptophan synthase alpha chain
MNQMSRIQTLFASSKAHIAYLTAGDGGIAHSLNACLALIEGGVNLIEIGVPFSDPVADGPVIQRASQRALDAHTTMNDVLWLVQALRKHTQIPLVLFSYLNPILYAQSQHDFLLQAKTAGVDGLLLVDCPIEESSTLRQQCMNHQIDLIQVITPATPPERIRLLNKHGQGFLYYACRSGTTGIRDGFPKDFEQKIKQIYSIIDLPLVVGFGISNHDMADKVLALADGVVVGSLFVKAVEDGASNQQLTALAQSIFSKED